MRQEVKDRRLVSVNKLEIRMSDTRSRSVPRTFEKLVSKYRDLLAKVQISVEYNYRRL